MTLAAFSTRHLAAISTWHLAAFSTRHWQHLVHDTWQHLVHGRKTNKTQKPNPTQKTKQLMSFLVLPGMEVIFTESISTSSPLILSITSVRKLSTICFSNESTYNMIFRCSIASCLKKLDNFHLYYFSQVDKTEQKLNNKSLINFIFSINTF